MSRTPKSAWVADALEIHERPLIRYAKWLLGDLESGRSGTARRTSRAVAVHGLLPLPDRRRAFADASPDFRFAASVAAFGMILKNSQYRGEVTLPWVLDAATASRGQDRGGYRAEFISLAQRAMVLRTALGTALGR